MKRFWNSLKTLTLPQGGALAVVLAGALFGGYLVTGAIRGPDGEGLSEGQQLVNARIGDLLQQVSTNGTVTFPEREWQAFEPQGTVGAILVAEGDEVTEGQAIATLDAATVASLERRLINAQIALRDAEDSFTTLVDDAEALVSARDTQDAAVTTLANAQADLGVKRTDQARKVADATTAASDADDAYAGAFRQWFGIALTEADTATEPATLLDTFSIVLDAVFAAAAANLFGVDGGLPADDPATAWDEATVARWILYPGIVTGTCTSGGVSAQDRCVQEELTAAWDASQLAGEALASTRSTADAAVFKAQQTLSTAEDALVTADEGFADAADGPDTLAVALAGKDVEIASIALGDARRLLGGATLRASMTGVVGDIAVEPGDILAVNRDVLEIVDPTVVEIQGIIDEIDVLSVAEGVVAFVSMDALPGQVLTGVIASIGVGSTSQQGLVTYPVQVRLNVPAGLNLREGLSATASVVISELNGVLLIPTAAVQGTFVEPYVQVMGDDGLQDRPVSLGDSDDFWVQVVAGLSVGEPVVMDAPDSGAFTFGGFGGGFGGFGGGAAFRQLGGGGFGGGLPAGVQVRPAEGGGFNVTIGGQDGGQGGGQGAGGQGQQGGQGR